MKFFINLLAIVFLAPIVSCNQADDKRVQKMVEVKKDTINYTQVQWVDTLINIGTLKQGEKRTITFTCKNIGNKPLLLTDVAPTCGCTVADYTKEAILPGKLGTVKANFDSKKFCGQINKTVIANSNTTNRPKQHLQFTGNIVDCESNDKVVLPHSAGNNLKHKTKL